MASRREHTAILPALAAALLSATVVIVAMGPMTARFASWAAEASTSVVAAAIWMLVGLRVTGSTTQAGVTLFVAGAGLAWFLGRGIVHSISPYYGITSFAAACVGAALAWWVSRRRDDGVVAGAWAIVMPLFTLLLGAAATLGTPTLGVTRRMWHDSAGPLRAHVIAARGDSARTIFLWTADGSASIREADSMRVRLELDPGSGGRDGYRLARMRDAATLSAACNSFRQRTAQMVQQEIARGDIPPFITTLPLNVARCASGTMWEIHL